MVDRSHYPVRKSTLAEQGYEDDLAQLTPSERMDLVWELTVRAWAMKGEQIDQQRLQRHVVHLQRGWR